LTCVREEQERFQDWLRDKLGGTVFTDTCPGWYKNAEGKVTTMCHSPTSPTLV